MLRAQIKPDYSEVVAQFVKRGGQKYILKVEVA